MNCKCCQGEAKRFGYYENRNRTVQRYRCTRCGTSFSELQPLAGVRVETDKAAQVVHLLCEGMGIRAISRLTRLDQKTVLNVLESAGQQCARMLDANVRNVKVKQCEVDEVYSFVRTRPDNTKLEDTEHGEFYCYLALDRNTKLIISHLVAKRNGENARVFLRDLKDRVTSRFQLSTDGWPGYTGNTAGVAAVFGNDIDYGSEVKEFGKKRSMVANRTQRSIRKFNPDVVLWVKRTPRIGSPKLKNINTSRAERLNLSLRLFNRRFTRLTLGYSKTLLNHRCAAALFTAFYNFCRVHSSIEKTPAQAAGIADHVWTAEDLVSAIGS